MADIHIESAHVDQDGRFSRFELISWWDQARLRNAKVLIVGAGALGNELVKNCALLGIGNILVADMDMIENSNLSRSVLFRESDRGRPKAEVACKAATGIYPELKAQPFVGNVVTDLGRGAYFWADVILGGTDNREARVAVNEGAFFAGKTWIDGAIEVLNGVARVFVPGGGPCYECTMSDVDWKVLESRRSCALLTRDEMEHGKVPTTPTTASIIAAFQMQEAVKVLHGMEPIAGQGFVYSGLTGESYMVKYTRKPDCCAHDKCGSLRKLGCETGDMTVGALLKRARADIGAKATVRLSRDVIATLDCPACGSSEAVYRALGRVSEREAACPKCKQIRTPTTLLTLGLGDEEKIMDRTFAEIGVPPYDVLTARAGERTTAYLFDGDEQKLLGSLSANA